MNYIKSRIVALIDMDCFYVQCEQRLNPDMWGKPCAVAQYNNWKGGGLIAVNYEARSFGVKRGMRGDDASKLCPDLHLFSVPENNGKADLVRYRDASAEVFIAIQEFIQMLEKESNNTKSIILERASVDEAFLDFTNYIAGKPLILPGKEDLNCFNTKLLCNDLTLSELIEKMEESGEFNEEHLQLILGAQLVGKMRQHIFDKTQFKCSAGISINKMLAKLACGKNKPNAQTILPFEGVESFFKTVKITDVRSLGGKLGHQLKELFTIETMSQLKEIELNILLQHFDSKTVSWLMKLTNGFDDEEVKDRRLAKSIGCGKNFPGKNALRDSSDVQHWVNVLCQEMMSRLVHDKTTNKRISTQVVVGYYTAEKAHCSKSINLPVLNGDYPSFHQISRDIMKAVFSSSERFEPILNLSLVATKFTDLPSSKTLSIENFFRKVERGNEMNDQIDSKQNTYESDSFKITETELNDINVRYPVEKADENAAEEEVEMIEDDNEIDYIMMDDPEVLEKIKKSFFFRKIMTLYNFESDDDSDMEFENSTDSESNQIDDDLMSDKNEDDQPEQQCSTKP